MSEQSDAVPQFTLVVAGTPLYRADPAPASDAAQILYALVGKPSGFPGSLGADVAWANWSGAFLFLPAGAAVADPAGLVKAVDDLLADAPNRTMQWVIWLESGTAQAVAAGPPMFAINKAAGPGYGHVAGPQSVPFANLAVQLAAQLEVRPAFDAATPGLVMVPDRAAGTTILLQQTGTQASVQMPNSGQLTLPFAGPQLGLLCLPLNGDAGLFYALFTPADGSELPPASAECRFYYGSAGSPAALRFPLLLGAEPNPAPPPASLLPLLATIDPLAPTDNARTRFAFDLSQFGGGGPALPVGASLRTTAGAALTLTPQPGAGFGLAIRPDASSGQAAYLSPAGEFKLAKATPLATQTNPPLANGAIELMCGVYGTEFLLVAEEDIISFVGNLPALAPDFTPAPSLLVAEDESKGPLHPPYSTAWVSVVPGANTGTTFPGPIKQSFCAQAFGSVYYQTAPGKDLPLPIAIGARIADLSDPNAGQRLPIAPYGLVFYSDDIVSNPNPTATAKQIVSFDSTVLSRARFASLAPDRCLGPLFFDMARVEALSGGYVRTPQGLLVELNDGDLTSSNPAGTWQTLLLARSPQKPEQLLQFGAGRSPSGCPGGTEPYNVVSPYLSTALMDPAAVLFIAQPTYLGAFDNLIQLGEFPIRIEVANDSQGDDRDPLGTNCVLIFKFDPGRSVAELAADPSSWGSVGFMTGDPRQAALISNQVAAYIEQAKGESGAAQKAGGYDYFADFLARVTDPAWTGILALNPLLDQQLLPPDIQMLLCGMRESKGLRCHHFGITANAAPGTGQPAEAIDKSALFGLVHYNADFKASGLHTPFDFQTLRLNALFDNSVIKHFDSRIAMSLATVLGNPAGLTKAGPSDYPDSNTIVIDGVLQVADGVTRVVFATDEERAFTMPRSGNVYRVLAKQAVNRAGLAPVTKNESGSGPGQDDSTVTVTAQFTLDGTFGFNTRPISSGVADLFSYGIDSSGGGGLGYSGYGLTMVSHVPPKGSTPPPTFTVPPPGSMQLDPSAGTPRDQSLMATLPLKVTGFATTMPGPDHSTQVEGGSIGLEAVTPTYALATELMMGTLGGLSDAGPLQGQLLLGWVPGGSDSVADRAGALLAAPPSMQGGSFRLQGVIPSTYGEVELLRPTLNSKNVYVLVLHDVRFALGAFGLYIPSMGERSLTFFGEPGGDSTALDDDGDAVTLSWFLGEPDLQGARARPEVPLSSGTPALSFTPAVYVLAGIKVSYDRQATSVVDEVISNLAQVPLSTKAALDDILSGKVEIPINYDPHAGVTVAIDLTFPQVTFKFVFSDPYVYGGYLAIAKSDPPSPPPPSPPPPAIDSEWADGERDDDARSLVAGNPAPAKKKGILSSLDGFELEIAYRKISDGLGAWSGTFTITGHIGTDDYYLQLPTIGLVIYTNSDFRLDVGWPFSPGGGGAQTIAVQFSIEGIPLRAEAGFYLAKLRSADAPGALGKDFAVIWRFGLGFSFGLNKSIEKGPMSLTAGLVAFLTFEGFLASTKGDLTENGVDYKWFAGQLGAKAYFSGEVDLKIVMIGVSASATLTLQVAYETDHATVIRLAFHLSIEVEFRILFIKVSFSFDANLDIFPPIRIGSGPDASIDGPDPIGEEVTLLVAAPVERPHKEIEHALLALHAAVGDAITIPLQFVLQPTTVNAPGDGSAAPQAVATLMINLVPDQSGRDDFSRFATALAGWLVAAYGGPGTLGDQLGRVAAALDSRTVDGAVDSFLSGNFKFQIEPSGALNAEANYAAFPMLSPLMLSYAGTDVRFDSPGVPAGYPEALRDYFKQLSPKLKAMPRALALGADPPSAADLVSSDVIILVAKQLVSQLADIAKASPDDTLAQALSALGPAGFANVAGLASRFAFNGVRLPVPGSEPFGDVLEGMYALTGQQVALRQVSGTWQTGFTLALAPGVDAPWITFGAKGTDKSVVDSLDPNLILTQPVVPAWLSTGEGLLPFPPVRQDTSLFYLGQPIVCTAAGAQFAILPLGDELTRRLAAFTAGGGAGATATVAQVTAAPAPSVEAKLAQTPPIAAAASLFVPIALRQIVPPGATKPLDSVFELVGTDNGTRGLLEMLVRDPVAGTSLSLLLSTGGAAYAVPEKEGQIVLAKANLSTLNQPPTLRADGTSAEAAQPPVSATLADVTNFLTLIWEESVVHSGGFYLYLPDAPQSAFNGGQASAALLVRLGSGATQVPLGGWCNAMVLDPVPVASAGAVTATVSDPSGTWSQANPNHDAGLAGFEVVWPLPPTRPALDAQSTPAQKAAYAEALYSLLQYRVTALPGAGGQGPALPTHWSLPVGPLQGEGSRDWHFSSTVSMAGLLGAPNRYAGTGASVTFGVTLLDLYGNQLPTEHDVTVPVVYNDPLLGLDQWPGARGYYAFAQGSAGKVALTLAVDFNPRRLGTGSQDDTDPAVLASALAGYRTVLDQLTDPLQAGKAGAGASVTTVFAAKPLTETDSGQSLTSALTAWVRSVIGWLESAMGGTQPPVPAALVSGFALDLAAPRSLPSDLMPLTVSLAFARDPATVTPAVAAALPSVQQVSSTLGAAAILDSALLADPAKEPDLQLAAFAQAFENAWYGFDGGTAQLKLAQGLTGQAIADSRPAALWFVRLGKGAGIGVEVPNAGTPDAAGLPVTFAAPPLSTLLISEQIEVRNYKSQWVGNGSDVILPDQLHSFVDIDMTAWAVDFLAAVEGLFAPAMAAAIATLDPGSYAVLADYKQRLADAIAPTLEPVLIVPGQTPSKTAAVDRFRQALLHNLSSGYALAAVVALPTNVSLAGTDEPSAPPNLYGRPTGPGLKDAGGRQPYTVSPATVALSSGTSQLVYLVSSRSASERAWLDTPLTYEIAFLEHDFEPAQKIFGYEPSSWLSFIVPDFKPRGIDGSQVLSIPLGRNAIPLPLRVYPPMPAITSQGSVPQSPTSLADALNWAYECKVATPQAAQDELVLSVTLNDPPSMSQRPARAAVAAEATADGDPPRPAPADLFEALARFAFEYPQIAPYLEQVPAAAFSGGNAQLARTALERMEYLIEGAVQTWPAWINPALRQSPPAVALAELPPPVDRAVWDYVVDFSGLPNLRVTRSLRDGQALPPWPAIEGFQAPPDSDQRIDIYRPSGERPAGAPLNFAFAGLPATAAQSAHVSARVTRNANLVPSGMPADTTVCKAFIYTTPQVSARDPVLPLLDLPSQSFPIGEGAAKLSEAIDEFLAPFIARPTLAGLTVRDIRMEVGGTYWFQLAEGGQDQTIRSGNRIFLVQSDVSLSGDAFPGSIPVPAFRKGLIEALTGWHSAVQPSDSGASIQLPVTLYAVIANGLLPLVRLGNVEIPVPKSQPGWWA
ncbi:MAG TPA: hypothetical protein VFQ67_01555 [Allosphingosinicella sp.]|jgi:hypothetical protein|nr:hypothetical protein [Allosphingosinicella sp.]